MEKLLKEITEQDIADVFNISLEELKKGIEDGTIYGYATEDIDEEIVDKFNSLGLTSFYVTSDELKDILKE